MDDKQRIMDIVDDKQGEFIEASDRIWDTPETRFAVKRSVEPYYEVLEKEGFSISKGVAGMEYAFIATYGSGKPVIGITAEYDALGNLSQEAGNSERKPLVPGGAGQGCGHKCARHHGVGRCGRLEDPHGGEAAHGHAAAVWLPRRGKRLRQGLHGA